MSAGPKTWSITHNPYGKRSSDETMIGAKKTLLIGAVKTLLTGAKTSPNRDEAHLVEVAVGRKKIEIATDL